MKQIKIGTCLPGDRAVEMIPPMVKAGFETFSINFHMEYNGVELKRLAADIDALRREMPVDISTIGLYCNPIEYSEHRRNLEYAIDCAELFGARIVSSFAGAYEGKPVTESISEFGKVFRELAERAREKGVTLGLENCPMDGNWNRCTCNIAFHPLAWEMMFAEVPADNIGLEWEPTHQMVQLIDPIAQLREWAHRIVHVHGKDATLDQAAVKRYGILGAKPFVWHRTPGFGDNNWRDIISILRMAGYESDICIEGYHDPIYGGEWEMTSQLHALQYLKWCRGGEFVANPWKG